MDGRGDAGPRFSVLIPTHNQSRLLILALRSVLAQSFQDFEILVVADGCTDGSQEAVRAVGDSRIRLFDLPKAPGFGYANRNVALREARGELIAFLAHDDLYLYDHLEISDRVFQDPEVHWACSRSIIVESDGSAHPAAQNLDVPTHLNHLLEKASVVPASAVVYRRVCHERTGYWNGSITNAGDRDFWSRMIQGAGREAVRFIPQGTTLHFRAPWRENLRGPGPLSRGFKDPYPDPWPLVIDLQGNPVEQEVYLEAMQADPAAWTARFRRDLQAVLDGRLMAFDARLADKRRKKWRRREQAEARLWHRVRRRLERWLGWRAARDN